ncbi:meiotic nuclear division protein 1 homolog [Uloborus diversus]|uniref:meiotic nuclear division protein 1 homolog n=1 Tax=Uloborus diversus TaxID=327109 RepID=UPI00240A64B0|nr:meiotic nuclear division protein 1 homolog [Uloborus diversus]
MSKKRGVSADEKRSRMLNLFYEKKDVFQLKELERIAPKEKGIVAQSVKEVVQSLVDEGLVDSEKVGTSVYFWAFPSKSVNTKKRRLTELKEKCDELKKKLKGLEQQIATAQCGRENNSEREKILKELAEHEKTVNEMKIKIDKYKDSDPEALELIKQDTEAYKEEANLWTDNIFAIKSWCKKKFFIEEAQINKQFGIPEELDYLE